MQEKLKENIPSTKYVMSCVGSEVDIMSLEKKISKIAYPKGVLKRKELMAMLRRAEKGLPSEFKKHVLEPLLNFLKTNKEIDWATELYIIAVLVQSEGGHPLNQKEIEATVPKFRIATKACQELVGDLFMGFLEKEKKSGVRPPEYEQDAPILAWGSVADGPFTNPVHNDKGFNVAVVSMPITSSLGGIFGWALLGHEVCGHDVMNANKGMLHELKEIVSKAFDKSGLPREKARHLEAYFSDKVEETAADVLGTLSLGPAAVLGFIIWDRAFLIGKMMEEGPWNDAHPSDLSRAMMGYEMVKGFKIKYADQWAQLIKQEIQKDWKTKNSGTLAPMKLSVRMGRKVVTKSYSYDEVSMAVKVVAKAISKTKLKTMENKSLSDIHVWDEDDEKHVLNIRNLLRDNKPVIGVYPTSKKLRSSGNYGQYVVTAACLEALDSGNPSWVFERMIEELAKMNRYSAWEKD